MANPGLNNYSAHKIRDTAEIPAIQNYMNQRGRIISDAYIGGIMVRLERHGDSYVLVTGTPQPQKQDIRILISALSELSKPSPDCAKIRDGLLYLDNCSGEDFRKEIRTALQKASE